jgi:hypothetical protein
LGAAASGLVVNASAVELEGALRSIDGNRDGANVGNGGLEIGFASGCNIGVTGYMSTFVGGAVLAGASNGCVWVGRLGINSALLNVVEGIVHKTSVATLVAKAR